MKKDKKYKTAVFGDCAEYYVAELFDMSRNERGQARPDLTSKTINPSIHLELKTGADRKGILYGPQFMRALHCIKDYEDLFKEKFPGEEQTEVFELGKNHLGKVYKNGVSPTRDIYYYGLVERVDGLGSGDLTGRYSSLKLKFGDHFLVPYEFALMYYVASKAITDKSDPQVVLDSLKEMAFKWLSQGIATELQVGGRIRRDSSNWQSFSGNDVLKFIMEGFFDPTTEDTHKIEYLRRIYPSLDDLRGVQIPGPNRTSINVLCKSSHLEVFDSVDKGLRGVIQRTTPIIEAVSTAREKAVTSGLVDMFHPEDAPLLFLKDSSQVLTLEQITTLERLVKWRL